MTTRQFILCLLAIVAWVSGCIGVGFLIAEALL